MWGFGGMMGGGAPLPSRFEEQYHCYSAAVADKAHLEVRGDSSGFHCSSCNMLMIFRSSSFKLPSMGYHFPDD